MKRPIAVKDNVSAQLAGNISGATTTLPLGTGEGASFPKMARSTATSGGTATALNSTGIQAALSVADVVVGDFIENVTDGSYAVILSIATDAIVTTPLNGGSDNTWQNGDTWACKRFVATLIKYDPLDETGQTVSKREKVLIGNRTSDNLYVETGGRGYDGSSAQSFDADDYVYIFATSAAFDGITVALADIIKSLNELDTDTSGKLDIDSSQIFGTADGGTDTYTVDIDPLITSWTDGLEINWRADVDNTGPAKLKPNGLAEKDLVKYTDQALVTGDIVAGQICKGIYDADQDVVQLVSIFEPAPPTGDVFVGLAGEDYPGSLTYVPFIDKAGGSGTTAVNFDEGGGGVPVYASLEFTIPTNGTYIRGFSVPIKKRVGGGGGPTGSVTFSVYASNGSGDPTGSALATETVSHSEFGTSYRYKYVQLTSALAVTAGNKYVVRVSFASTGSDSDDGWSLLSEGTGAPLRTSVNGSAWSTNANPIGLQVLGDIAWENYNPPVVLDDGNYTEMLIDGAVGTSGFSVYGANNKCRIAFTPRYINYLKRVIVKVTKNGTPAFNFNATLYAADASDAPTGGALATAAVAAAGLSGTQFVDFALNVAVTANSRYVVVFDMAGGGDGSNNISVLYNGQYFPGSTAKNTTDGSTYNATTQNGALLYTGYKTATAGRFVFGDPRDVNRITPFGVLNDPPSGVTNGSQIEVKIGGLVEGYNAALTPGSQVYWPWQGDPTILADSPFTYDGTTAIGTPEWVTTIADATKYNLSQGVTLTTSNQSSAYIMPFAYSPQSVHYLGLGKAIDASTIKVGTTLPREYIGKRTSTSGNVSFAVPHGAKGAIAMVETVSSGTRPIMRVTLEVSDIFDTTITEAAGTATVTARMTTSTLTMTRSAGTLGNVTVYFFK